MSDIIEKPVRMLCHSCGGSLELVDDRQAVCKYCESKYLIDDVRGLVAEVNISARDKEGTKVLLKILPVVLVLFFIVMVMIVHSIWKQNLEARNPKASSQETGNKFDLDSMMYEGSSNLTVPFCEDIFEKKFSEITAEEFASIKYLAEIEDVWNGNELHYSFTDYKDCVDEEAFQDTVKTWKIEDFDYYSMYIPELTGLTRVENLQGHTLRSMAEGLDITYVAVNQLWMDTLHEVIEPEKVEILRLDVETDLYHYACLDYLQKYVNVKDLHINGHGFYLESHEYMDVSKFTMLSKVEKLHLSGWGQPFSYLDKLVELSNLKSLTLEINNTNFLDANYLIGLTQLEELRIGSLPEDFDANVFAGMTNLRVLCLPYWTMLSTELIESMPQLQEISGRVAFRSTVEAVAKLENLRFVELTMEWDRSEKTSDELEFPVIDMMPFAQKPQLEHVKLKGASAVNVELLLNHPKVKSLDFNNSYNMIEGVAKAEIWIDTTKLMNNDTLMQFSVNHCKLMDSSTNARLDLANLLGHYPQIKLLELENMKLVSIAPIVNCKNLRECNLRYNKIEDFSPLQECKKLELIHVYENPEESIVKIKLSPEVVVDKEISIWD